jgi:hypothetical protein
VNFTIEVSAIKVEIKAHNGPTVLVEANSKDTKVINLDVGLSQTGDFVIKQLSEDVIEKLVIFLPITFIKEFRINSKEGIIHFTNHLNLALNIDSSYFFKSNGHIFIENLNGGSLLDIQGNSGTLALIKPRVSKTHIITDSGSVVVVDNISDLTITNNKGQTFITRPRVGNLYLDTPLEHTHISNAQSGVNVLKGPSSCSSRLSFDDE